MLEPLLELDPELALPDGTSLAAALAGLGPGQRVEKVGRSASFARRSLACAARSGSSHAGGSTGRRWPGNSGMARSAISPAGRSSIAGRRSSRVIARRRLAAIWRSAAFGGSPPSTPSAIQSSTRWSWPGSAARSARTASSSALFIRAAAATIGAAVLTASPIGTPSLAPSA